MAMLSARPATRKLICEGCGCTDDAACDGGCHWVSFTPPVCSCCVTAATEAGFALDIEPEDGPIGVEHCPASPTPAPHAPLFTSETEWHCARCHQAFFT